MAISRMIAGYYLLSLVISTLLHSQENLCDTRENQNSEKRVSQATKFVQNYLTLDERVLSINQNMEKLDSEFLCSLDILRNRKIGSDLENKLLNFIPKPWNKKDWLADVYSKLPHIISKEKIKNKAADLQRVIGTEKNEIGRILSDYSKKRLNEYEINQLVEAFKEFPTFVFFDFIKSNSASRWGFFNSLKTIDQLDALNFFDRRSKLIQAYSFVAGECQIFENMQFPAVLSCKDYKRKIIISEEDLILASSIADEQKIKKLVPYFQVSDSPFSQFIEAKRSKNFERKKFLQALQKRLIPDNLLTILNIDDFITVEDVLNQMRQLEKESKFNLISNLRNTKTGNSVVKQIALLENDPLLCLVYAIFFKDTVIPFQGKLSKVCSNILLSTKFCENFSGTVKAVNASPLSLLAPSVCLHQVRDIPFVIDESFEPFLAKKGILAKIFQNGLKVRIHNPHFLYQEKIHVDIRSADQIPFEDEDNKSFYLLKYGSPELISSLKSNRKVVRLIINQEELHWLFNQTPLLARTFNPSLIANLAKKFFLNSENPDESLMVASFLSELLCYSESRSHYHSTIEDLINSVKNFRQLVQLNTLKFLLTGNNSIFEEIALTPFTEDVKQILRRGCE
ncbi:MAG: hypothetical protein NZO16_00880 [Deltaproteobacteria bacterium]|nr:hypothetical protein [Deltaproteobacteria bacterium]